MVDTNDSMYKIDAKVTLAIFQQALIIQLHGDGSSLAKLNLLVYDLVN